MPRNQSGALPVALLVVFAVAVLGMVLGSWRTVLYPSLLLFGLLIALGVRGRHQSVSVAMPAGVTVLFLALFATLDLMSVSAPRGDDLVLGLAPTTALYLFGVAPAFLLVALLFALTFRTEEVVRPGASGAGAAPEEGQNR